MVRKDKAYLALEGNRSSSQPKGAVKQCLSLSQTALEHHAAGVL